MLGVLPLMLSRCDALFGGLLKCEHGRSHRSALDLLRVTQGLWVNAVGNLFPANVSYLPDRR
jgi:hypothetical protein